MSDFILVLRSRLHVTVDFADCANKWAYLGNYPGASIASQIIISGEIIIDCYHLGYYGKTSKRHATSAFLACIAACLSVARFKSVSSCQTPSQQAPSWNTSPSRPQAAKLTTSCSQITGLDLGLTNLELRADSESVSCTATNWIDARRPHPAPRIVQIAESGCCRQ